MSKKINIYAFTSISPTRCHYQCSHSFNKIILFSFYFDFKCIS